MLYLPTARIRQQQNPLACSMRNKHSDLFPLALGSIDLARRGLARTMLPGSRSGNAKSSSDPIFAQKKAPAFIWGRERTRSCGADSSSRPMGAISGTGKFPGLFRNHGTQDSGSSRDESRIMVRFEGRLACKYPMSPG